MFPSDLLFRCVTFALLVSSAWSWPLVSTYSPYSPYSPYKARNLATISRIYNLTVYPNQLPIFINGSAAVPPGLFATDATGRVDPVGNFTGFEDSVEYFFALAPVPQMTFTNVAITSFRITEFSSACPDVAASVVYLFTSVVDPGGPNDGKPMAPLKQVAFWKFTRTGAVIKYDAWIPNLNAWIEASLGAPVTSPQGQAQSILQLCGATQQRCTGNNTQWASVEECVSTLSTKPFGNYDEAWGDNIVCRNIHVILTRVRPEVHCPHVGPTGGGKCVDISDQSEYFTDERLYGDPLGQTFVCPHLS